MPSQFTTETTLDTYEDQIFFTRAALAADPDAKDLLPTTDSWMGRVQEHRALQLKLREVVANADALRAVTNQRMDNGCSRFADALNLAVKKDRTSARWKQFFGAHTSIIPFIKQATARQVRAVLAWAPITDDAFAPFKEDILRWANAADGALNDTASTATLRGQVGLSEERLAEDLTRERDGLYAALISRANERSLGRDWPDTFFRVTSRSRRSEPDLPTPAPAPTPVPA